MTTDPLANVEPLLIWEPEDGGRWASVCRVAVPCVPGPVWGGWVGLTMRSPDDDEQAHLLVPSKARELAAGLIAAADAADELSGVPLGGDGSISFEPGPIDWPPHRQR